MRRKVRVAISDVLPETEGMAGYKNYAMHFKGFLIGTVLSVVVGFIVATFVAVL